MLWLLRADWDMWAAVGQLLGAAATFLAVFVALYLAGREARVALTLRATVDLVSFAGTDPRPMVQVVAVNVGQRPVTLIDARASFSPGQWVAVSINLREPPTDGFPLRLDRGERAVIVLVLEPRDDAARRGIAGEWLTLHAHVYDPADTRYSTSVRVPAGLLRQGGGHSLTRQP